MSSGYYIRPHIDDVYNRSRAHAFCIALFIFLIIPLTIMMAIGVLNIFPMIPWGYGYIYHTPDFLVVVLFIATYTYYIPALIIALIIAVLLFVLNGFISGISIYTTVVCYTQSIPVNCTSLQATNIIVDIFSVIIWLCAFIILLAMVSIVKRAIRTIPKKRKLK